MPPIMMPISTIRIGSSVLASCSVAVLASASYMSATLPSMSGSVPDSSPTDTICATIGGNTPALASGVANDRPSRTDFSTSRTACSIAQLLDACPTVDSACSSGTPAPSIIERLRENRATAILVTSLPNSGARSLYGSTTLRTASVRRFRSHQNQPPITSATRSGNNHTMLWESPTRIWVGSGSSPPIEVNIFSKIGTMKAIMPITASTAIASTTIG